MTQRLPVLACAFALLSGAAGCKPHAKEISSLQRKEAATLVSEAQFALQVRDLARAEGAFEKAANLCPDTGDYWLSLGQVRKRLGKRDDAKKNYQNALAAYEDEAARQKDDPEPLIQQVTVLALLGRADDARALAAKLPVRFPNDTKVRSLVAGKSLELMLADPAFRELAF